jgi:hypothetical protein
MTCLGRGGKPGPQSRSRYSRENLIDLYEAYLKVMTFALTARDSGSGRRNDRSAVRLALAGGTGRARRRADDGDQRNPQHHSCDKARRPAPDAKPSQDSQDARCHTSRRLHCAASTGSYCDILAVPFAPRASELRAVQQRCAHDAKDSRSLCHCHSVPRLPAPVKGGSGSAQRERVRRSAETTPPPDRIALRCSALHGETFRVFAAYDRFPP